MIVIRVCLGIGRGIPILMKVLCWFDIGFRKHLTFLRLMIESNVGSFTYSEEHTWVDVILPFSIGWAEQSRAQGNLCNAFSHNEYSHKRFYYQR